MQTYQVTASVQRDGQLIACDQAEVLGDAYGVTYYSQASAQEAADAATDYLPETDLDPATQYDVREAGEVNAVVVEYMPEYLRASHEAANNRGEYPHNGAIRRTMLRSDADIEVECGEGWASIVSGADPARYLPLVTDIEA